MSVANEITLGRLVDRVPGAALLAGAPDTLLRSVALDSRRVGEDALFVALRGAARDGLAFVADAEGAGACAVAVDAAVAGEAREKIGRAALVGVPDARRFAAEAAAHFAGRPSESLIVVAVTGTSGKTTTAYLVESILAAAGHPVGVIGTIEYRFRGEARPAPLTTPDAVTLQSLFGEMLDAGVTHVVIEASSHALEQSRVDATEIDAGIYTNLTRDHLDYHGDTESYARAKARLFRELLPASRPGSFAVLNADNATTAALAESGLPVPHLTFGDQADVSFSDLAIDLRGIRGRIRFGEHEQWFRSSLIGRPHLENVLAAAACAWRLGIDPADIATGIEACGGVPGRLETIDAGQDFSILVDYAHKPDALERTLASLRPLCEGRLIVLFGCGGDRDRGKRPQMGKIAARGADLVILTSDNPRTEDPEVILREIEAGALQAGSTLVGPAALGKSGVAGEYVVVPERRAAIDVAVASAGAGDVVLIAGKGHEDYQIVGTEKSHFDDREEVRRALGDCA